MISSRATGLIAIDLFAGVGGLGLGFEQAGFDVVAAVEYDPTHAVAHRYNFPQCEILCRDIRRVSRADLDAAARRGFERLYPGKPWPGQVDVLIGGPSCQGFSAGGLRKIDDERNGLLLEFVRLVEELRPRAFCFENVPGLLEPRFDDLRSIAIKRLREAGYAVSGHDGWLNALEFGVPQSRKRVFVIGIADGPAPDLPTPGGVRTRVADALQGLPRVENYPRLLTGDVNRLHAADASRREQIVSPYARRLAGLDSSVALPENWIPLEVSNSLRTTHSPAVVSRFAETEPGSVEPISRLYRLDPESVARTLRAGTGRERGAHTSPRPIHPTLPRVITVREAARLHSYPDWFRFNATNWHGHRQIGNSVPPLLAESVATCLVRHLGSKPDQPVRLARSVGDEGWRRLTPSAAASLLGAIETELPAQRTRSADAAQRPDASPKQSR